MESCSNYFQRGLYTKYTVDRCIRVEPESFLKKKSNAY